MTFHAGEAVGGAAHGAIVRLVRGVARHAGVPVPRAYRCAAMAVHAHSPCAARTDDAAHRAEATAQGVHAGVLERREVLLVHAFRVRTGRLEEHC